MNVHFSGLYLRLDWDGYLTLKEAREWYKKGNGLPLYVDLEKIDLSGILSLGEKYVGQEKVVNLFFCSNSLNDAMVLEQIKLKRYSNNSVRAYSDIYNFEQHSRFNPLNWGRNIEILIGGLYAGKGTEYEINIYGEKRLQPILPWIK